MSDKEWNAKETILKNVKDSCGSFDLGNIDLNGLVFDIRWDLDLIGVPAKQVNILTGQLRQMAHSGFNRSSIAMAADLGATLLIEANS